MQELLVDFITSLDGYAAAEGWPGFWGLQGPKYLAWLGEQPEREYTILIGANTYRLMSAFAAEAETLEADEAAAVDELAGTPTRHDDSDERPARAHVGHEQPPPAGASSQCRHRPGGQTMSGRIARGILRMWGAAIIGLERRLVGRSCRRQPTDASAEVRPRDDPSPKPVPGRITVAVGRLGFRRLIKRFQPGFGQDTQREGLSIPSRLGRCSVAPG